MQGEQQSGEKRGPMWEVRHRWDLDRVKAKANCQDRAEEGKRKKSEIREGPHMWTGARAAGQSWHWVRGKHFQLEELGRRLD